MANRITSVERLKKFMFGARVNLQKGTEEQDTLGLLVDEVTSDIENFLGGTGFNLKQAIRVEKYGNEHYRGRRRQIRLRNHINVVSVNSVIDDGTTITEDTDYRVDLVEGRIYALPGYHFTDEPLVVQVDYTSGYLEVFDKGTLEDERRLDVAPALELACKIQATFLWSQRKPGGATFGTLSTVRADGSVSVDNRSEWVLKVLNILRRFKR